MNHLGSDAPNSLGSRRRRLDLMVAPRPRSPATGLSRTELPSSGSRRRTCPREANLRARDRGSSKHPGVLARVKGSLATRAGFAALDPRFVLLGVDLGR